MSWENKEIKIVQGKYHQDYICGVCENYKAPWIEIKARGWGKTQIARKMVRDHIRANHFKISCDEHPSWKATHQADPWIDGDPVRNMCCLCYGNLMEMPHTKNIWLWKIGEKSKYLSRGSK